MIRATLYLTLTSDTTVTATVQEHLYGADDTALLPDDLTVNLTAGVAQPVTASVVVGSLDELENQYDRTYTVSVDDDYDANLMVCNASILVLEDGAGTVGAPRVRFS